MKIRSILVVLLMVVFAASGSGQTDTTGLKTYRIVKTDGGQLIGKILSQDAHEILLLTRDNRQIYIPQYEIKEMIELSDRDFNSLGVFVGEDKFATRYFLTTNGLPIRKEEDYVLWNFYGPDFQFGLGKNVGVGLMTTWIGSPIIGTIKKSFELGEKSHLAIGALAGTGSWAGPGWGGILPFVTLSFGDRKANLALTGGYGEVWSGGDGQGRIFTSVAGMVKISTKLSLVFDSFIMLPDEKRLTNETSVVGYNEQGFSLFIPGIRWHQAEGKALQFGFAGLYTDGELIPFPLPMIQWFRTL